MPVRSGRLGTPADDFPRAVLPPLHAGIDLIVVERGLGKGRIGAVGPGAQAVEDDRQMAAPVLGGHRSGELKHADARNEQHADVRRRQVRAQFALLLARLTRSVSIGCTTSRITWLFSRPT